MFPLVCLLCLTLTVPNLALTYRLVRNRLFGSVFNLHSVFMFLLTAVKTPLSVATKLTLITGADDFHEFSCYARPMIDLIWGGSMVLGTFYNLLFKYETEIVIVTKPSKSWLVGWYGGMLVFTRQKIQQLDKIANKVKLLCLGF